MMEVMQQADLGLDLSIKRTRKREFFGSDGARGAVGGVGQGDYAVRAGQHRQDLTLRELRLPHRSSNKKRKSLFSFCPPSGGAYEGAGSGCRVKFLSVIACAAAA